MLSFSEMLSQLYSDVHAADCGAIELDCSDMSFKDFACSTKLSSAVEWVTAVTRC